MKLVSGSRSRDGIATVSSWTEINQGAIHTDVTAGCRASITLLIIARVSRFQLAVRTLDDREVRCKKAPKESRGRIRSPQIAGVRRVA